MGPPTIKTSRCNRLELPPLLNYFNPISRAATSKHSPFPLSYDYHGYRRNPAPIYLQDHPLHGSSARATSRSTARQRIGSELGIYPPFHGIPGAKYAEVFLQRGACRVYPTHQICGRGSGYSLGIARRKSVRSAARGGTVPGEPESSLTLPI